MCAPARMCPGTVYRGNIAGQFSLTKVSNRKAVQIYLWRYITMENSMTITKTRNDAKLILKNMPKELQAACDKIFVAGADFGGAIVNMNEHDSALRLALLEASNTYGKPENSEFKGFGEFACAVFGFTSAPAVTNAVKVAEHIDQNKIDKLASWYSTGMLYELRDVPVDTLREDIKTGKLRAGMTQKALRQYNAAHKLESGKPKPLKLYDASITRYSDEGAAVATVHGVTLEELKTALVDDDSVHYDDTFFTFFNPHATLTRIMSNGSNKETVGKGLVFIKMDTVAKAVYFPAGTKAPSEQGTKTAEQDEVIAKMRAKMLAAGLDPDEI